MNQTSKDYEQKRAEYRAAFKQYDMRMSGPQEEYIVFMNLVLTAETEKEVEELLSELFLLNEYALRGNYQPFELKGSLRYFHLKSNDKKELRKEAKKVRNYFIKGLKADLAINPTTLTKKEAYVCYYLLAWLTDETEASSLVGKYTQKKLMLETTRSYFRKWDRSLDLSKMTGKEWEGHAA